jgi:glycosyltransferase involved in cell wall biosynthesis
MHEISLIIATLGERPEDLCLFLRSVVPQSDYLCDIIVVDQNPDEQRIPAVLEQFRGVLPIRCIRSERGLSRARNHALPLALGTIVAFPDDDCLYPQGLLEWVVNWFESSQKYDILAVGVNDASGAVSGNRWPQNSCEIHPINVFRTTLSSSLFVRTDIAMTEEFDVRLGLGSGTPHCSGEETDYVLRLIRAGARGRFDRTRHIIHPRRDMLTDEGSASRAESYGLSMGHLLRIHALPTIWVSFLAYNLARTGAALGCGNLKSYKLCVAQTKGLWKGYLGQVEITPPKTAAASSALHVIATQPHPSSTQRDIGSISPQAAAYRKW